MVGYEDPTFFIKGGDGGFVDRQKSIFDKLMVAEKERNERQQESGIQNEENPSSVSVSSRKRKRSEMKQFRGKESIFKRPEAPPPRFKNKGVPDHHKNPHKWIKYSLADVSQEDMSEKSNAAAALSFLRELEERKHQGKMEIDITVPSQITFQQPKNKNKLISQYDPSVSIVTATTSDGDKKPTFRSSKLIMPEYVVGLTRKKDRKKQEKADNVLQAETSTSHVKLQHLMEDDDQ